MPRKKSQILIFSFDKKHKKVKIRRYNIYSLFLYFIIFMIIILGFIYIPQIKKQIKKNNVVTHKIKKEITQYKKSIPKIKEKYDSINYNLQKIKELEKNIQNEYKKLGISTNVITIYNNSLDSVIMNLNINELNKIVGKSLVYFVNLILSFNDNPKKFNLLPTRYPADFSNKITRKFGYSYDPLTEKEKFHSGIDITGPIGSKVFASGDGIVIKTGIDRYFGKYIIIKHSEKISTYYAHLNTILVKKGQRVKKSQVIGTIGSSGVSLYPHLHFEIRINQKPVNPLNYLFL